MEADASKLLLTFKKIAKCSNEIKRCYDEFVGCCSEDQPKSEEKNNYDRRLRIAELLKRQLQLSLEALSCLTVRQSLSETIRTKFHDEKKGTTIGSRGLSEFLQLIDDYADSLPLYVASLNRRKEQQQQMGPVSALYPPLVGSIALPDSDAIPIGSLVAAWKKEEDRQQSKWILAEVLDFRVRGGGVRERGSYTLLDHVAEFEFYRDYFVRCRTPPISPTDKYLHVQHALPFLLRNIPRREIVPLTCFRVDPRHNGNALFGPGSLVMARFPKTSVFYRACVLAPPENLRDGYRVTFDLNVDFDPDGHCRNGALQFYTIPQMFVVQCPPGKRRSRMQHEEN